MATSSTTGSFRREPGDWPCSNCNEVNFKSRTACRRCSTPRTPTNQRNPTQTAMTSGSQQMIPKPGDWTCDSCTNLNFAARAACHKCGKPKREPMQVDQRPERAAKPGDWKCSSCPEMNFGTRTVCRSCGAARPSTATTNEQKRECVICMENPIDSVITTCGHSAMCLQCGTLVNTCPICRSPFSQQNIIKMFNVH